MAILKKLKIKLPYNNETQDICTIEEAMYRFNWGHEPFLIIVEGRFVSSFEELIRLSEEEPFKEKDFLDVEIQPLLAGG